MEEGNWVQKCYCFCFLTVEGTGEELSILCQKYHCELLCLAVPSFQSILFQFPQNLSGRAEALNSCNEPMTSFPNGIP